MVEAGGGEGRDLDLESLVLEFVLLSENTATHFKDGLKAFTASLGVLSEAIDTRLLHLILDLLPTSAEGGDFRFLGEFGRGGRVEGRGLVNHSLADVEDVGPGEVGRAHGDLLGRRVDVGNLIDVGSGAAAKECKNPLGGRLVASDKTFGSQLSTSQHQVPFPCL